MSDPPRHFRLALAFPSCSGIAIPSGHFRRTVAFPRGIGPIPILRVMVSLKPDSVLIRAGV